MNIGTFPLRPSRRLTAGALALVLISTVASCATPTTLASGTSNDNLASATIINSLPFTVSQDTSTATSNANDPLLPCHPGTHGSNTVWFRYTPTVLGVLRANTAGSSYDTVLAIWRGAPAKLINVACNDDAGVTWTSSTMAILNPGVSYFVEVADFHPAGPGSTGGEMMLGVTFAPMKNLLGNPGFEIDQNQDGRADGWSGSSHFTRTQTLAVQGHYAGKLTLVNNGSATIHHAVGTLTGGQTYYLAGYVDVPSNVQGLTFTFSIAWYQGGNNQLSQDTVWGITGQTGGWFPINSTVTAPPGATSAQVQLAVTHLTGTVYIDNLTFGH